ncbi:MAG: hypothetical protein ACQEUM_07135 [Pseudomonadota bacterium]
MIDNALVAMAAESLSPEARRRAEVEAKRLGITVSDVILEKNLEVTGALRDQLYALRHQKTLTVVEGGRA